MERPDKNISRYDKSWQEYADFLEQTLERLISRLEEIENSARNYLSLSHTGDNQRQTYATRLVMAEELKKELDPDSMGAEK